MTTYLVPHQDVVQGGERLHSMLYKGAKTLSMPVLWAWTQIEERSYAPPPPVPTTPQPPPPPKTQQKTIKTNKTTRPTVAWTPTTDMGFKLPSGKML